MQLLFINRLLLLNVTDQALDCKHVTLVLHLVQEGVEIGQLLKETIVCNSLSITIISI